MKLRVASFQFTPEPLSPRKNLEPVLDALARAGANGVNLVLLPELWPCGLLEDRGQALAQARQSPGILAEIRRTCEDQNLFVAGGMPELGPGDRVFNTLFVTGPGGFLESYRKIHLFPLMHEHKIFTPGTVARDVWIDAGNGEIGLGCLLCFDIRFPELARELACRGVDILLCPALWPMSRRGHFETFLRARAMENQCFLLAANACGRIGQQEFAGASSIIAPDGQVLGRLDCEEGLLAIEIDLDRKLAARKAFFTSRPPGAWALSQEDKVLLLDSLATITQRRKRAGQRMVFTNGCFDILHAGHVSYLQKARALGDFLVAGLNSDQSVRAIKGSKRPVNTQDHRAMVLSALSCVDYVVIFDEETPLRLIHGLKPDVLVKGADWEEDQIVGADFVKANGGRVARVEFDVPVSTTGIIEKIRG